MMTILDILSKIAKKYKIAGEGLVKECDDFYKSSYSQFDLNQLKYAQKFNKACQQIAKYLIEGKISRAVALIEEYDIIQHFEDEYALLSGICSYTKTLEI